MNPAWVGLALFVWLFVPIIFDLLGCRQQHNLDVYERWVEVQLNRKYHAPSHKGFN